MIIKLEKNTFKRAEAILYEYKYIDDKLDIINFKLDDLKNDVNITAVDTSRDNVSPTNAFSSEVENEVIKRERKINELENTKKKLIFNKTLVEKTLKLLDETEKEIVRLRYFSKNKKTWFNIAAELNMTTDNCTKKRRKIIEKIQTYLI